MKQPEVARRTLTGAETVDWAAYASRVIPLPGRRLPTMVASPAPPQLPLPATPPPILAPRPRPRWPPLTVGEQPAGVDNATWRRLRTGRVAANRTLDLHGYTAQHAFHALDSMLRSAQAERARCIEIITGRGSGEGGGVLRREVPLWLNLPQLRPMVLAAVHPHAANTGAIRVLLRRPGKQN